MPKRKADQTPRAPDPRYVVVRPDKPGALFIVLGWDAAVVMADTQKVDTFEEYPDEPDAVRACTMYNAAGHAGSVITDKGAGG